MVAFFLCVCFRETWEKVNLQFHENGTLTFNQRKTFKFDAENSAGSEDDMVVIPNIPMLVSILLCIDMRWKKIERNSV